MVGSIRHGTSPRTHPLWGPLFNTWRTIKAKFNLLSFFVFIEKLIVAQLVKKSPPPPMGPGNSVPYSRQTTSRSYSDPVKYGPRPHTCFFKINFDINSYHRLDLQSFSFLEDFLLKFCMYFSCSRAYYVFHHCPTAFHMNNDVNLIYFYVVIGYIMTFEKRC